MKIILDIETVKYPLTGIGRYTCELAKALQATNTIDSLLFKKGFSFLPVAPDAKILKGNGQVTEFKQKLIKYIKKNDILSKSALYLKSNVVNFTLNRYKDHIYHGPNFFLPKGGNKKICTIHDLSFIDHPKYHPDERVRILTKMVYDTAKIADGIITVSNYSKIRIAELLSYPLERIAVTPLAASNIFIPQKMEDWLNFGQRYSLKYKSYSLYVGTVEPRKNINILLNAYEQLPKKIKMTYPLIICGHKGWKSEHLHEKMKKLSKEGWLKYYGFLDYDDLPKIVAGAKVFLYPSFYEGFGLPPLEAMQAGVPVLVSNQTSLPEVVWENGPLINPLDTTAWLKAIEKALTDKVWEKASIALGLEKANEFSWNKCANETLHFYKKVWCNNFIE